MISSLTAGALLGLSAGFAPGPLLALVIAQTLRHNIREGIKVALAPLITDLPIILVSLFVLTNLSDFNRILGLISGAGGLYVLYLSYESVRTGPVNLEVPKSRPQSFKKGTLINALNPHPYLFWATVGAPLILKFYDHNLFAALVFILCFYLLLVGSKIFLAVIVGKSRSFLTSKGYIYIMRILGGLLAFFAFFLFKDAFFFLGLLHS